MRDRRNHPNQGPGDSTTRRAEGPAAAVSHATQEKYPNVLAGVFDVKQPGKGANQCVIWGSVSAAIAGSGSLGPGL